MADEDFSPETHRFAESRYFDDSGWASASTFPRAQ